MPDEQHIAECDLAGIWCWIVPDFESGRSRILGMPDSLLERITVTSLRQGLENTNWLARIDEEPLIVERSEVGVWSVAAWKPDIEEKWFPDPRGGFFVAFQAPNVAVAMGGRARLSHPYLALHGRTWSAMGPNSNQPARSYNQEELITCLPDNRSTV